MDQLETARVATGFRAFLRSVFERLRRADVDRLLPGLYLVVAAAAVLPYLFLQPPLQTPDAPGHFTRAIQTASGHLFPTSGKPGPVPAAVVTFINVFGAIPFRPDVHVTAQEFHAAANLHFGAATTHYAASNVAGYPFVFYLPQAMAVLICRGLGANILETYRWACFANAMSAISVSYVALRICRVGRPLLLGATCLPMALSLDYSVSQDALLAACIALVYALITTLLVAENSHPSRTIFEVCGLIALICASKPVYILLLGFVLAVGFTRNGPASRSVRRLAVQRRRAALIGTVLAGMFALAWTATQPTGLPAPGARSHRTLQTRLLEHHPVTVAHDILTSMHIQAIPIWKSTLGVLGWLDTVFPLWVYVLLSVAIVLLLVASAPVDDDVLLHRPFRGVALVFVCSAVPLVYLVVFLGFNQGFGEIAGVQGRYLTPLLPYLVLVVAGGGRWVRWIRRSAVHQVSTFVGYGVILFSTTAAVGLTLLGRYFG